MESLRRQGGSRASAHAAPFAKARLLAAGLLPLALLFAPGALTSLSGCAHVEPPPGGSADSTGPRAVGVSPAPGATGVDRRLEILAEFSEWIAPAVNAGQVSLWPPLPRRLHVEVHDNRLRVHSASPLEPDMTYVLTVDGSLTDLNGIPMGQDFVLRFSTGKALDSARVSGVLGSLPQSPKAPLGIALYPRDSLMRQGLDYLTVRRAGMVEPAPEPDPQAERPMYAARADSAGRFVLDGIKKGSYAVLAFLDQNLNGIPDLNAEEVGFGNPALAVDAATSPLRLAVFPYAHIPARLEKVEWSVDAYTLEGLMGTIRLTFDGNMHPVHALQRSAYRVEEEENGDTVSIWSVNASPSGLIELNTRPLKSGAGYRVLASGALDFHGRPVDSSHAEGRFQARPEADTSAAALVFLAPPDLLGEKAELPGAPFFPNRPFRVYSTRTLDDTFAGVLQDSLMVQGPDTLPLAHEIRRLNAHEFEIGLPPLPLDGGALTIWRTVALPDTADSARQDTLASFRLAKADEFGSLRLTWSNPGRGWKARLIHLESGWRMEAAVEAGKGSIIDSLPPGRYTLGYYHDENGDGFWTPGGLDPWRAQEPFSPDRDTVEIFSGRESVFPPLQGTLAP